MGYYDEEREIEERKTMERISQSVVNDTLEYVIPVVIIGVRDNNVVEYIGCYSNMFLARENIKDFLNKYKKIIKLYGDVKDGLNSELESHT